jgi:hypothetical protein
MLPEIVQLAAFVFTAALGVKELAPTAPPPPAPLPDPIAIAAQQVASLDTAAAGVEAALRTARARHDPERSACLDDLLSQVHAEARDARALRAALEASVQQDERVKIGRELDRLALLGERAERLTAAAYACQGRTAEPREGTTVVVFAPSLPDAVEYPRERK